MPRSYAFSQPVAPWNEPALYGAFQRGLGEALKDALAGRERPTTLNQLISLSITLDECYRERKRERVHQHLVSPIQFQFNFICIALNHKTVSKGFTGQIIMGQT